MTAGLPNLPSAIRLKDEQKIVERSHLFSKEEAQSLSPRMGTAPSSHLSRSSSKVSRAMTREHSQSLLILSQAMVKPNLQPGLRETQALTSAATRVPPQS